MDARHEPARSCDSFAAAEAAVNVAEREALVFPFLSGEDIDGTVADVGGARQGDLAGRVRPLLKRQLADLDQSCAQGRV
jgi:hypothetical protein